MKQSKLFTKTQKEAPKDEKSINAKLLTRGGFIYKEMAGVYSFLPLGFKVLKRIEQIIREEMNKIGGQEILMTVFQPRGFWEETGRWDREMKEVMYRTKEGNQEIGLGPTHEEMLTDIIRHYVKSYQDLPLAIYQIQTKFRKELRPRSGLLRGKEFPMKDLYSFHASEKDFKKYYQLVIGAYRKIFKRCGLETVLTEASGAGFTKDYTHEFQILAETGEDRIVFCEKGDFSQNKEIAKFKGGDKCPKCQRVLKEAKSIEVANIFPLKDKYSKAMSAFFVDRDGQKKPLIMGCYGIGLSRTMAAVVEIHHDNLGIIWPKEIAPFDIHLLELERTSKVRRAAEKIYKDLIGQAKEVLYDERDKSAGEKLAIADLIGIPLRIVVSERTLTKDSVEVKPRNRKQAKLVKLGQVKKYAR